MGAAGTVSARRHYSLTLSHSVTNVPRYYVPSTVSDSRWPIRHAVRFPSGAVSKGTGLGYIIFLSESKGKILVQTGIWWYHKGDMLCVPPAESVCGSCVGSQVSLTLRKLPQIDLKCPHVHIYPYP